MHLINMSNVEVSYPKDGGGRTVILEDVNIRVRPGELTTVVGSSGCGKSTLLRMVLGSNFPTSGTVLVDGVPVQRVTRDCGIVYQDYSLFPHLTVLENIGLGLVLDRTNLFQRVGAFPVVLAEQLPWVHAFSRSQPYEKAVGIFEYFRVRKEARDRAHTLLDEIGLKQSDANKYPYELSGGMRQRVAIAQAIMMRPKILLMDEPFGALDAKTRTEMQDWIFRQWRAHNLTIFFVTHDLDEACKLGTRLICLSRHWVDAAGNPGQSARVVIDRKIVGGETLPSEFMGSNVFAELVTTIQRMALDSNHSLPMAAFDLSHPDAVRAVAA